MVFKVFKANATVLDELFECMSQEERLVYKG